MEVDVRREEALQPPERDRLIDPVRVKTPAEQSSLSGSSNREDGLRESRDHGSIPCRPDDTTMGEEDFLDGFDAAFVELLPTNQGDAIAEPLPTEYSDQIMLPPAFDAKGVKSKFITPSNLDDFALNIRDTNRWHKYRNHPTFLPPEQVNLANLDSFIAEVHKGQNNRHEKRGRGQHAQHNREHGRHQKPHNSDRAGKHKRYIEPSERKRKWDDRMHDTMESDYQPTGLGLRQYRIKVLSPLTMQSSPYLTAKLLAIQTPDLKLMDTTRIMNMHCLLTQEIIDMILVL
ncbi:hypothetical protein KJ359_010267 [Pestalotiopsis sp. 9143b]|nr:hypothetical protein KJ359_010267 [Pestalotiopsis sp. 9143b]